MKRIFYKIIYVVILFFVVSCFINLKFDISANGENNSYSLIGKLNCADEIDFSTIRLNIYSFDVQNKDLISESELLTSIYVDSSGKITINQNISSCYVEVDLFSLPFGYGIKNDNFVYTESNLIMIDIIKIDKIVINNLEINDVKFYSNNDSKLLAIYSNEQLNNIDKIIYNEPDVISITTSQIYGSELMSNTSINSNNCSTYNLDNNLSSSIVVNDIKFQFNVSVGNYGSNFESIYNSIKQYVVAAYLSFGQLFDISPHSEILDDKKVIIINIGNGGVEYSGVDFDNNVLKITYYFNFEKVYSNQYINYVVSHELGHYFLYFITQINNNSLISSTVLDEGIAEFMALYHVLISNDVSFEDMDSLLKERILSNFENFLEYDYNCINYNFDEEEDKCYGYTFFATTKAHLYTNYSLNPHKDGYSYFSFFLFLYEYYDDEVFDLIFYMLEFYVEKLSLNGVNNNFLIEMFEYLESNNGQLENQTLNYLNYDIEELIEKFNLFTSFPSQYITSLPQDFLFMWDSIVFEKTESIYTGSLLIDEASVYEPRNLYDDSFSYKCRRFIAKSQNDNNFENENFMKMYLRYYSDMAIQIIYKTQDNEVTYFNQYYYYDENISTTEYNSKNLVIYVPASTECIIYVYYLNSNETCNESKVRFANLNVVQDEMILNNNASSHIYKLNEGTIFKRANFLNGQYKINLLGDFSFKYTLYDENLNLVTEAVSIESEVQDNVVNFNNITLNGIYYFSIKLISSPNGVVQLNIYKNTFASTYSSNNPTILNETQQTINSIIQIKVTSYGLYNLLCDLPDENCDITILIYEDERLTRKYGKTFDSPLARYYDNTANIFLRSDKTYTIEIIITSTLICIDNFSFGIYKYNDSEIGNSYYQLFELNSSQKYGTGIVFKSIDDFNYTISIGYFQNNVNNIDINVYICKVAWNGGIYVTQMVLSNSNKSNFINISLTTNERIFICIDNIISNDFVIEVYTNS